MLLHPLQDLPFLVSPQLVEAESRLRSVRSLSSAVLLDQSLPLAVLLVTAASVGSPPRPVGALRSSEHNSHVSIDSHTTVHVVIHICAYVVAGCECLETSRRQEMLLSDSDWGARLTGNTAQHCKVKSGLHK